MSTPDYTRFDPARMQSIKDEFDAEFNRHGVGHAIDGLMIALERQERIVSRLTAERPAQVWQPIASAPNDGTRVLLWIELSNGEGSMMVNRLERGAWQLAFHGCFRPTRWMPLPPDPLP